MIPVLKRRGWRPRVIAYDGYGSAGPAVSGRAAHSPATVGDDGGAAPSDMARVLARMVLRPRDAPAEGPLFRSVPEEMPMTARGVRDLSLIHI